ncbi:MAG: ABC transporter C-terminal domain-containing protein [Burkholderiaceae bacterium]
MVAAIGSTALPSSSTSVSPTAGLEAQITRYQKQLSDCVNCDSANTAQGKEAIQEISNKISAVKAKIEEINVSKPVNQTSRTYNQVNTTAKQDQVPATAGNQASAASNGPQRSATATVGTLINVSA